MRYLQLVCLFGLPFQPGRSLLSPLYHTAEVGTPHPYLSFCKPAVTLVAVIRCFLYLPYSHPIQVPSSHASVVVSRLSFGWRWMVRPPAFIYLALLPGRKFCASGSDDALLSCDDPSFEGLRGRVILSSGNGINLAWPMRSPGSFWVSKHTACRSRKVSSVWHLAGGNPASCCHWGPKLLRRSGVPPTVVYVVCSRGICARLVDSS